MSETVDPTAEADTAKTSASASPPAQEPKPLKVLPTTRAKLESQLSILRAFAAASGAVRKSVQNTLVAEIADVSPSTVSSCNSFFADIGLLEPAGRGYVPADAVIDFSRAWEWNQETAPYKLAPVVENAWFWGALKARLSFRQLTDDVAVEVLAEAAASGPAYRTNLVVIIELLAIVGLIVRENGMVSRAKGLANPEQSKEVPETRNVVPIAQAPTPALSPANSMSITMSLAVPMDQISRWNSPEKVQKFFEQWANLLNAKVSIEQMLKDEAL